MVWDWTPDGDVYFTSGFHLRLVPATGRGSDAVEIVTERREGERVHARLVVLPGGKMGVFQVWYAQNGEDAEVWAIDLGTRERWFLVAGNSPSYASTGHLLFGTPDGALMAAPIDPSTAELTGPSVLVAEGLENEPTLGAVNYSVSEDGTLVYSAGGSRVAGQVELVWVTRLGLVEPVAPGWSFLGATANVGWRLSPDDGRLVFKQAVEGNHDIWVKVLPDGPESRLTFSEAADWMPRWAPDGQTITFASDRSEAGGHLWSKRADGTGEAEVLFDGFAINMGFWSPDGEWLVLRRSGPPGNSGARDILAMRPGVDTVALPLIADENFMEQGPAISPDGRWLAYSSNETGRDEVFVRPFPEVESGKWRVSTEGGIRPLWAHSGRELFFVDATGAMVAAEVETKSGFQAVGLETLFTLPEGTVLSANSDFYDITSDDQRFLMARAYGETEGSARQLILIQNFFEELKERMGGN